MARVDMSEWNAGSVIHFAFGSLAWPVLVLGLGGLAAIEFGSGGFADGAGYGYLLFVEWWGFLPLGVVIGWVASFPRARNSRGFGAIPILFIPIGWIWVRLQF